LETQRKKWSLKRKILTWFISIIGVILVVFIAAGFYFFRIAEIRADKDFINDTPMTAKSPVYPEQQFFLKAKKQSWSQTTKDGLKLDAWYLPNEKKSNKTAVIAHGFAGSKEKMAEYGTLFYNLGYNVLIPDDRAHGESEGKFIGYGWLDRKDYIGWIQQVIDKNGKDEKIVMFGLSMGAATTMMTSGEKLPENVKAFVEDCGYDSVWNEIKYQAKALYNLPAFPLIYEVSAISKLRAGYDYKEASSVAQLKKNKRPMLFIHGGDDDFVPTEMVYKNWEATQGQKELLIVPKAKHAESYATDKALYTKTVGDFVNKWIN
jgi:fermentation-respiration switch protein FrsA (DUF1100 family)